MLRDQLIQLFDSETAGFRDASGLHLGGCGADVRIESAGGSRSPYRPESVLGNQDSPAAPCRLSLDAVDQLLAGCAEFRSAGCGSVISLCPAADGRGWKYSGFVKFCPIRLEPITAPL